MSTKKVPIKKTPKTQVAKKEPSQTLYVLTYINFEEHKYPNMEILGIFKTHEEAKSLATNEDIMEHHGAGLDDFDNTRLFEIAEYHLGVPIDDIVEVLKNAEEWKQKEQIFVLDPPAHEELKDPEPSFPPLGTLFSHNRSYSAPIVRRIIGYTKTLAITQEVPVVSRHDSIHNGYHKIDESWLLENPVPVKITKSHAKDRFSFAKFKDHGWYLKKVKDYYYEVKNMDTVFESVEY